MPSRNDRRLIEKKVHKALADIRCPAHGGAPTSVKLTWNSEHQVQVNINPVCCDEFDQLAYRTVIAVTGAAQPN